MTIKGLASEIAKREGKKSQARIGDIREILGILSDMVYAEEWSPERLDIHELFFGNGLKRARKRIRK